MDPIGTFRYDLGWAQICATIVNTIQGVVSKKGSKPKQVTPDEFIPDWGDLKDTEMVQSVDEMKSILLGLAQRHNAILDKQGGDTSKRPPRIGRGKREAEKVNG